MKKLAVIALGLLLIPVLGLAQEQGTQQQKQENDKVKFAPHNARSPMLSSDEVAKIEEQRRREVEEKIAAEQFEARKRLCQKKAEEIKLAREKCLKENPYLRIVDQIKIQGVLGDEVQINNDSEFVGNKIKVKDGGQRAFVKITKITDTDISFKYEGKKFSLPISNTAKHIKKMKEKCATLDNFIICEDVKCELSTPVNCEKYGNRS